MVRLDLGPKTFVSRTCVFEKGKNFTLDEVSCKRVNNMNTFSKELIIFASVSIVKEEVYPPFISKKSVIGKKKMIVKKWSHACKMLATTLNIFNYLGQYLFIILWFSI